MRRASPGRPEQRAVLQGGKSCPDNRLRIDEPTLAGLAYSALSPVVADALGDATKSIVPWVQTMRYHYFEQW
jgi:hypothetical protein